MITTYFETATVILWCCATDAHRRRLATAFGDDMALYSPIAFGGI